MDFHPKAPAIFAPRKVTDYLLSSTHPIGRFKSAFFRSLGYSAEAPKVLERDLVALLKSDFHPAEATEFGQKYVSRGQLQGPNGRAGRVLVIWIILAGETAPRFVTAYPEE